LIHSNKATLINSQHLAANTKSLKPPLLHSPTAFPLRKPVKHMPKVLVCDPISEAGLDILRKVAEVEEAIGLPEDELIKKTGDCEAIMVRSGTKITRRVLEHSPKLQIVGRAGVGVDNIDVPAATEHGVIVVNSPAGNTVAVAELALGMMLTLVRKLTPAHNSVVAGEWKRSKFLGTELYGKTLGIVGVGKIGIEVAKRAQSFGMSVIGFDPFLTSARAAQLGIEAVSLEEVWEKSDFITLHTPLTKDTRHLVNAKVLASMKSNAIILNCARGGIIDETALYEAISSGQIGGAGLDVYEVEPPQASPLFSLSNVILTPHLGASTEEAQVEVALDVARQIVDVLGGRPPQSAVNLPPLPPESREFIAPFLNLMEKLGRVQAQIRKGRIEKVEITYCGDLATHDVRALTRVFLKGLLMGTVDNVSYVNAPALAEARGIQVIQTKNPDSPNYQNLVQTKSHRFDEGEMRFRGVDGTIFNGTEPHIVSIQGLRVDVVPEDVLLLIPNHDSPGMVGKVGTILGDANVNIVGMQVGRKAVGERAVMLINLDEPVSDEIIEKIDAVPNLFGARIIDLR
jgi:D-3-phosphoglycerate dehydrogenase